MRLRFQLNPHYLVLAVIALLSFGAIVLKKSDQYLQVSAAPQSVKSVNAANYLEGPVAPESLVAAFGNNLAAKTETSQSPLMELAGVKVEVTDSAKVTHEAQLLLVSSKQINYLMPAGVALGAAQVAIKNDDVTVGEGDVVVAESAPALFAAGPDGKSAVGMTSDDDQVFASITNSDGSPRAVSFGSPWRPNTLTVLGTGIRRASNLRVLMGNEDVAPIFVGPHPDLFGVDQVVFRVPTHARSGMTSLSLVTNSQPSNTVQASSAVQASNAVQLLMQPEALASAETLNPTDVQTIIAQAVAKAQQLGFLATIAVVDKEANVLGVFKMNGARSDVLIGSTDLVTGQRTKPPGAGGLEGVRLPLPGAPAGLLSDGAALAAISKAGTAAFFSTQGSAITTRTAGFIVQENFPPTISSNAGGPLFGVQFSSLPCSDIKAPTNLPLGLSADPGGLPLYKNGVAVGGMAVEGDGLYSLDLKIMDIPSDQLPEELIAIAAIKSFRPSPEIQADTLFLDGMRLPYVNAPQLDGPPAAPFVSLPGTVISPIRGQLVSQFTPLTLGGIPGRVDPRFFPFKGSAVSNLTADDVNKIITQAAQQAFRTRAAIRRPLGSPAEVNIAVVDPSGVVLGIFSTADAPVFGFDVSAQKARTSAFFSLPTAGAQLRAAGFGAVVDAAAADGVQLDGRFAFTSRSVGFLARPFFPDGIPGTRNGPFSKPINIWSPFNVGLQLDLVLPELADILTGGAPSPCTTIPNLPHGIQIFAGSAPLFKNGVLVGAIGISGDGIEQDDIVAAVGSVGFEAPAAVRADQLTPRGVRLPFVKFPRSPNLRNAAPRVPILRGMPTGGNVN